MLIKRLVYLYLTTFSFGECLMGEEAKALGSISSHSADGGSRAAAKDAGLVDHNSVHPNDGLDGMNHDSAHPHGGLDGTNHDLGHPQGGLHGSAHSDSDGEQLNLLEQARNQAPDARLDPMERAAADRGFEIPRYPHPEEWRIKTWWVEHWRPIGRKLKSGVFKLLNIIALPLVLFKPLERETVQVTFERMSREPIGVWEHIEPEPWWSRLKNKLGFGPNKSTTPPLTEINPDELRKHLRGPVEEEGAKTQAEKSTDNHESSSPEPHPEELDKNLGGPIKGEGTEKQEGGPTKDQESPANTNGKDTEEHINGPKDHEDLAKEEGTEDQLDEIIKPPPSKWQVPAFPPVFSKDPVVTKSYILGGDIKNIRNIQQSSNPIENNGQSLDKIKKGLMDTLYHGNPAIHYSKDMADTLQEYVASEKHLNILERLYHGRNELLLQHWKMQGVTNQVVSALGGEDATRETFRQILHYHKKINSMEQKIGDPEKDAVDPSLFRKYTATLTLEQLDPAAYKMHLSPLLFLEEVTRHLEKNAVVGLKAASGYLGSTPRLEVLMSAAYDVEEYARMSREVDVLQNKVMVLRDNIPAFFKSDFRDPAYLREKFNELLTIEEKSLHPKRFDNGIPL